ncbi:MAG: hypothetical protein K2I23_00115, partial [Clostridia bacterium]|nr:hypothetical protein [Clostridia bacterium]
VNQELAVRPAFHLNLRKISESFVAVPPTYVISVYNGKSQTIDDIADDLKKWYSDDVLELTYPTSMKTVGDYEVTAKISKTKLQEDPDFVFGGQPNTNKGEDETTRKFTFTIEPKPLSVSWKTATGETWTSANHEVPKPTLNNDEICGDATGKKDDVSINYKYTGTLTAGDLEYTDTAKPPKKAGKYTVEITLSNDNYTFATTAKTTQSFTLDILKLNLPTFVETSWYKYNGSEHSYTVDHNSFDSEDMELSLPTEFVGVIEFNPTFNLIKVTDGGEYYLWVSIKDKQNAVWADDSSTNDKKLIFKVLPGEIEIDVNDKEDSLESIVGEDIDLSLDIGEIPDGHTIVLDITAEFNGAPFDLVKGIQLTEDDSDTTITKTLTADLFPATGNYLITLTLRDGEADNHNFELAYNTITIVVEPEGSDAGKDIWRITKDAYKGGKVKYHGNKQREVAGTQSVNWKGTAITFDGKTTYGIEFTPGAEGLVVDDYNSNGYIHGYMTVGALSNNNAIGINADTYTTTVRLLDTNNGNQVVEYTITWSIAPYKFDLSKVTWENVKDGVSQYEYIGESQSPRLKDLPSELKLNLTGLDTSATNVGKYS